MLLSSLDIAIPLGMEEEGGGGEEGSSNAGIRWQAQVLTMEDRHNAMPFISEITAWPTPLDLSK